MKLTRSIPVLALLALLAACSSGSKESTKIEEGETLSKNPLGALSQLAKAGSDLEKIQKDLENMKPVEALHFNELIKYLPEAPGGWTAEPARGETSQMGEWKFSQANRQYSAGDKSIEVRRQAVSARHQGLGHRGGRTPRLARLGQYRRSPGPRPGRPGPVRPPVRDSLAAFFPSRASYEQRGAIAPSVIYF